MGLLVGQPGGEECGPAPATLCADGGFPKVWFRNR